MVIYVQLKEQSGLLLSMSLEVEQGKNGGGATRKGHYSPTCV